MTSFIYNIAILTTLCQCTYGLWNSNIYHDQVDEGLDYPYPPVSSEEELNIGIKSSNGQYYNSREAHVDILDIVDGRNTTRYHYDDSDENRSVEILDSTGTIIEGNLFRSGVKDFPYPQKDVTSEGQYYNSREAHGDILDIVDRRNVTRYQYDNSDEYSDEERFDSAGTIIEGNPFKSGSKEIPYPLMEKTYELHEFSNYDQEPANIRLDISDYDQEPANIRLDISDYLEAISDRRVTINENTESHHGQAELPIISVKHSSLLPFLNAEILDAQSRESKEDLTQYVNTKSVNQQNLYDESKEVTSLEDVVIYSSDTRTFDVLGVVSAESSEADLVNIKSINQPNQFSASKETPSLEAVVVYSSDLRSIGHLGVTSAESSETALVNDKSVNQQNFYAESKDIPSPEAAVFYSSNTQTGDRFDGIRLRPVVHHNFSSSEISLPTCVGRKKFTCDEEQNLCRTTGDCRIARIWGTCCHFPTCGSYCKPNRPRCPHPNSIKEACTESDKTCSPLKSDCPRGKSCCQVLPCGYRCV